MSYLKTFNSILTTIDSFGVTIEFRINKKEQYKSPFGGFITLIYVLFGIGFLLSNFNTFYTRSKMTLNYTEKVFEVAPKLNLTEGRSSFAFGLVWENNSHIDMNNINYFDITLSAVSVSSTVNKTKLQIPFAPCIESDFYNVVNDTFRNLKISNMNCPKDTKYLSTQGEFTDKLWRYIEITIKLKNSLVIESQQKVRQFIMKYPIKLVLYVTDSFIDVDNFTTPLNTYISSLFVYLDFDYYKKLDVNLMNLEFSSDVNPIMIDPIHNKYIMLDNYRDYGYSIQDRINSGSPDFGNFARIYIKSSQKSKVIERTYQKFSEYLSNTTVLVSNGYLLLYVVCRFINSFYAKNVIMRKILNFKDHIFDNEAIEKIKKLSIEESNIL